MNRNQSFVEDEGFMLDDYSMTNHREVFVVRSRCENLQGSSLEKRRGTRGGICAIFGCALMRLRRSGGM